MNISSKSKLQLNKTQSSSSSEQNQQMFRYPPETPQDKEKDEENIDWNDPDLLNNPEKLMRLKFDEPLLQAAKSPTFLERIEFETDLILEDTGFYQLLKDYRNRKVKCKDEQPLVAKMDQIIAKLEAEQEKGIQIYLECKSKPFWDPQSRKDMMSKAQKIKVEEWVHVLQIFAKTFEEAVSLRFRRTSTAPSVQEEPEAEKLVAQLHRINQELLKASAIFDMILK